MDDHLWPYFFFLPHPDDGAKHVPDRGKTKKTDAAVLRYQVRGPAGFSRALLFHFCGYHVRGPSFTGEKNLDGGALPEAATDRLMLS